VVVVVVVVALVIVLVVVVIDDKKSYFNPPQGVAALQQLAIDVSSESVCSDVHYSFDPNGRVIGCYGRSLLSSSRGGQAGWFCCFILQLFNCFFFASIVFK
jgi:hypothetical protein